MKGSIYFIATLVCIMMLGHFVQAQNTVIGKWKTVDDETGETKSIVELYKKGEKMYGKVVDILNPQHKNDVCNKCEAGDPRKNQRIIGMEIITHMQKRGNAWEGGEILDPEKGKVYRCKIWVENGKLQVRGYVAFFFRTQEWLPAN